MGRKIIKCIMVLMILFGASWYVSAEGETEREVIECEEPNGESGYYTKKPIVYVHHLGESEVTKILFTNPDKESREIVLGKDGEESLCIDEEWFSEGKHNLEVWQENESGEEVEESRIKKEFLIDTIQPEQVQFSYEKDGTDDVLFFSGDTFVELEAKDEGAGIKEICYQLDGEEEIKTAVNDSKIVVPVNYAGCITAWAVDLAGNRNTAAVSKYITSENNCPQIEVTSKEDLTRWHNKNIKVKIEVKEKEILSGIAVVRCYLNGKLVEEKNNILPFIPQEEISVEIKETSEIIVEAEDLAGNKSSIKQQVLVDKEKPKISVGGIYNRMIAGEKADVSCEVQDDQKLQEAELKVLWKNENDEEILLENQEWKRGKDNWELNTSLEEDGIYNLELQAKDMAGNSSIQKFYIVIDKTNPVIRYVEELNGKYLQNFRWGYWKEDMIWDFTHYTYEIRLDGKLKDMQVIENTEGKHVFSVKAIDSAGNHSEVKAEFIIDHTKPVILCQGIDAGEVYEESAEVAISTEKENDKITEILLNGEKQQIDSQSEEFKYIFDEIGTYEMIVKAEDLAGNTAIRTLEFEVIEKEGVLEKIFYKKPEKENKKINPKEQQDMRGIYIAGVIGCIVVVSLGIVYGYKKKKSHKREDAG